MWDRKIEELTRANDEADQLNTPRLVREAVTDSGRDNTTAVVVEIL